MKQCPKCQAVKPPTDYYRNRLTKDNLSWCCKSCDALRCRPYNRKKSIKSKYGLSLEDYDRLKTAQGGVCRLCGGDNGAKELAVDHNHETGKIRGLLCNTCNRGIGLLGDKPDKIKRVLDYLTDTH